MSSIGIPSSNRVFIHLTIRPLQEVPFYVEERSHRNLLDCTILEDFSVLCFFKDLSVKKINLNDLPSVDRVDKIISNRALFETCQLGTDGFYITFNDSIDIQSWQLYKEGQTVPLSYGDFLSFTKNNIIDTTKACEILECTRQNLGYMVKQNQLTPLVENAKGNLYLKKDVLGTQW